MTVPSPAVPAAADAAELAWPGPPASERRRGRHRTGFWLIAAAFLVAMAFNAVPSPLYPLYQARDGFATVMVTVVFAVFAFGVAASLLLFGHVSDWLGRKRILVLALALELVADAIFLGFPALPGLLAGRLLGGVGIGMITATATAHLHELHKVHRPAEGPGLFEIVSTGANVGGLAVGPLIAGALAQYVAAPLRTPYLVFGVLLFAAIAAVAGAPETVRASQPRPSYRPQRVSTDHGDRSGYLAAAASGFAAFAVNGVYTSLSAGFIAGTLHRPSHFLAGTVAFALMAAAAFAQTATSRLTLHARQLSGLIAGTVGLVLLAVAVPAASLTLFLLAGIVAGAGSGMLTKTAIGAVAAMAAPTRRGEALSSLFLICYAGMSLPAIGVGIAVRYVSLTTAMYFFCGLLFLVLAAAAALAYRSWPKRL